MNEDPSEHGTCPGGLTYSGIAGMGLTLNTPSFADDNQQDEENQDQTNRGESTYRTATSTVCHL